MEWTEKRLEDISRLKHRVYTCTVPGKGPGPHEVMVIAFEGDYGFGSSGNDDARFMSAIILSALTAWPARACILDLRLMSYTWGDRLAMVLFQSNDYSHGTTPTITVVSDRNKPAIESLLRDEGQDPTDWVFDSLEEAIKAIEDRLDHEALTN